MKDVTTTTGTTIEHLPFTEQARAGIRRLANTTITDQASYAYGLAHGLSDEGETHAVAHAAGFAQAA
ncbi:hypothetical protein ACM01_14850 [Streptomyces viridochromogenes]|uniref:Uncharacterized protein n=1 Tax=Streptomyces viridochromogenes TaxID=1938 RepID=A0A0J7ZFM5_STRVR|nr:hypothetical protein [Streptomyces viridochromogenes]KMS74197.1 hypothetical protein ACM01_14850 [Streptomyces viridochromogenes]